MKSVLSSNLFIYPKTITIFSRLMLASSIDPYQNFFPIFINGEEGTVPKTIGKLFFVVVRVKDIFIRKEIDYFELL